MVYYFCVFYGLKTCFWRGLKIEGLKTAYFDSCQKVKATFPNMSSVNRFTVSLEEEKERIMEIRKAKSTNDATRHWIETLREFFSK